MKLFVDIKLDEKAIVTWPYFVSMKAALTKGTRLLSEAYRQWIKHLSHPQGRVIQVICNGQPKFLGLGLGEYVRTTGPCSFLKISSSLSSMERILGLMRAVHYLQSSVKTRLSPSFLLYCAVPRTRYSFYRDPSQIQIDY